MVFFVFSPIPVPWLEMDKEDIQYHMTRRKLTHMSHKCGSYLILFKNSFFYALQVTKMELA